MRAARGARHLLAVSCVAFAALANAAETALPPGVLILHGNQRALPTGAITDDTLRNVITSELGRRVDLYSEYLDVERFPTDAYGKTNAEFIQRKYGGRNIRVVIPSGPAAYQFMEAYGSKLLPGTPIVQLNVPREFLPGENPPPGFLGAIVDRDPKGTFELAMRLQPAAKRLVIVTGSANQDRVGERRIRAALDRISSGLVVEHLSGLPTPDLLRRLGALAPDTIIYTPGYFMDGGGVVTTPATSVGQMAAVATAPMYGPSANFIGAGAVGGSVFSVEDQAKHIGGIVVKLLNGVAPAAIPPIVMPNVPTVDWRQLRRWGLDEKLLPPGSVVRYRSPTVWEQYRWYILAGFVIFAVQAATISGLLLQRRHVRGVQAELRLRSCSIRQGSRT
jgi:ABC-type uncharacterized transport system substrate-binding protein